MADETKRPPIWMNCGALFETEVDGHTVLTGGLFGRQAVAVKAPARDGKTMMWKTVLLNVNRDHDAACDLARKMIAKQEFGDLSPGNHQKRDRPILTLKKETTT